MDGAAFIGADAFAGETDLEKKQWSVVRIVLYYTKRKLERDSLFCLILFVLKH